MYYHMKKTLLTIGLSLLTTILFAQSFTTNTTPVGMEHNLLFNATTRYDVEQTGSAKLNLTELFNGVFRPSYPANAPTPDDPTVVVIENLPNVHIQAGAWVGWSTRYWQAKRFKIEGYNSWGGADIGWKTFADYSSQDYTGGRHFKKKIPISGSYTKLRFTFYSAYGTNGRLGVSELFFLHPEATKPYDGILVGANDAWVKNDNNISYTKGKIGIGTTTIPEEHELAIAGSAIAEEVVVKLKANWPDYVFSKDYKLPTLTEVEQHIKDKGHLANIPTAEEVAKHGVALGEMNQKLLEKIEELTLYTIAQEHQLHSQDEKLEAQAKDISELKALVQQLLNAKK